MVGVERGSGGERERERERVSGRHASNELSSSRRWHGHDGTVSVHGQRTAQTTRIDKRERERDVYMGEVNQKGLRGKDGESAAIPHGRLVEAISRGALRPPALLLVLLLVYYYYYYY
jgi:hypothetical protein